MDQWFCSNSFDLDDVSALGGDHSEHKCTSQSSAGVSVRGTEEEEKRISRQISAEVGLGEEDEAEMARDYPGILIPGSFVGHRQLLRTRGCHRA